MMDWHVLSIVLWVNNSAIVHAVLYKVKTYTRWSVFNVNFVIVTKYISISSKLQGCSLWVLAMNYCLYEYPSDIGHDVERRGHIFHQRFGCFHLFLKSYTWPGNVSRDVVYNPCRIIGWVTCIIDVGLAWVGSNMAPTSNKDTWIFNVCVDWTGFMFSCFPNK